MTRSFRLPVGLGLLCLVGLAACASTRTPAPPVPAFDIVGHRGARGLLAENTLPSFRRALELGATTLEIDVVMSRDSQVVVSHEPWMRHVLCRQPDGSPIPEDEERAHSLFEMTYAEIERYDCGSREHPGFPEQTGVAAPKPLLRDVIRLGERVADETGRPRAWYNIEVKSSPDWDDSLMAAPDVFAPLLLAVIQEAGVARWTIVQSFDVRVLQAMRRLDPSIRLAVLISDDDPRSVDEHIARIGFVPASYNPNHRLVDRQLVREVHARGMTLVPWTINELDEMRRLQALGVDGVITDYPDRARALVTDARR